MIQKGITENISSNLSWFMADATGKISNQKKLAQFSTAFELPSIFIVFTDMYFAATLLSNS